MKILAPLLLAALSLAASPAQAAETENVTFCRVKAPGLAHVYVAEKQGFFEAEGLRVTIQDAATGKICQDSMLAGKSDFAGLAESTFSYLGFSDPPLRLLAQLMVVPATALVARKDRGIGSAKDLKGKTIGYLPGGPSFFYLSHLLESQGLAYEDIKPVTLQPSAMVQALKGGMIDGFVMWEPWSAMALAELGANGIRLYDPSLYELHVTLAMTSGALKAHPHAAKKMLKALMRAEKYIKERPAETRKQLAQEIMIGEDILESEWAGHDFTIKLDQALVKLMAEDTRVIIREDPNYKGKQIPDFSRFIDSSFLRDVSQDRVEKGM